MQHAKSVQLTPEEQQLLNRLFKSQKQRTAVLMAARGFGQSVMAYVAERVIMDLKGTVDNPVFLSEVMSEKIRSLLN
jgi:hypothetical protein